MSSSDRRRSRRAVLKAIAAAPFAALVSRADARDYASAAEVLGEIDRLEAELDARLAILSAAVPSSSSLVRSVLGDHDRHRRTRSALRRRLHLAPAAESAAGSSSARATLAALQILAQDLVHAHAEGLPALRDTAAVGALARDMVDDARHLAILQMWAEAEEQGA